MKSYYRLDAQFPAGYSYQAGGTWVVTEVDKLPGVKSVAVDSLKRIVVVQMHGMSKAEMVALGESVVAIMCHENAEFYQAN